MGWLVITRGSNLPTVWSNALLGLTAGWIVSQSGPSGSRPPAVPWHVLPQWLDQSVMLLLGLSLIYVGGMVLNDAVDAKVDAVDRPERPIPVGHIRRRTAWLAAAALLASGGACLLVYPRLPRRRGERA